MKENELKPCPFCGSTRIEMVEGPTEYDGRSWYDSKYIECQDCFMRSPHIEISDDNESEVLNELIELWNRRAGNEQREAD